MSKELADLKLYGIRSRQRYLNQTDWMVTRLAECTTPIDQDIIDKRQVARDEISLLRDSNSLDEIVHIVIEF